MGLTARPVSVPDGLPSTYPLTPHWYGTCPACEKARRLTSGGVLPSHKAGNGVCEGTHRPPTRIALSTGYAPASTYPVTAVRTPHRRGRALCPHCERSISLNPDGTIRRHGYVAGGRGDWGYYGPDDACDGSGIDPTTGTRPLHADTPPARGYCRNCQAMILLDSGGMLSKHSSLNPDDRGGQCARSFARPTKTPEWMRS